MRMNRRAGLLSLVKLPTLAELMADMTVVCGGGPSTSTTGTISTKTIDISSYSVSYPYCLFITIGPAASIIWVASSSSRTVLKSYGTLSVSTATTSSIEINTASYGFAYMVVKFPNYADSVIKTALQKMTLTHKGSRASTPAAANDVYFNSSAIVSNAVYIAGAGGSSAGGRMSISWGSGIATNSGSTTIVTRSVNNTALDFAQLVIYSSRVYLCRTGDYNGNQNSIIYGGVYELKDAA